MSISYWIQKSKLEEKKSDVVIVGAGIAGLSCAYWWLQERPSDKVIIVEKNQVGQSASGRNAGFVTCGSIEHMARLKEKHRDSLALQIWKHSDWNRELMKTHLIKSADAVDFKQCGSLTVALTEKQRVRLFETASWMSDNGLKVKTLDPKSADTTSCLSKTFGAVLYLEDGQIHPYKLVSSLRNRLETEYQVQFIESEEVQLNSEQEICTQRYHFKADHFIFATNAWSSELLSPLRGLIAPQRGQALVTEPSQVQLESLVYLPEHLVYYRQLPDKRILIGGFRQKDPESEQTFSDVLNPKIQNELIEFSRDNFFKGKEFRIQNQWSGLMGFTSDGQMILGKIPSVQEQVPKTPNCYVIGGCSGHGMGLNFSSAKLLVDHILTGAEIPRHLSVRRFFNVAK